MFIIHIGPSGFPKDDSAIIQRIKLTFKSLKNAGCNPLIICKHSLNQVEVNKRLNLYQGIPYILTSVLLTRPDNFLVRNLNKISGYIGELILLVKKRKSIDTAILYGHSFFELVYYRLLSKILNFKIVYQYVELSSSITYKSKLSTHINALLVERFRFYFCDGIIVISEFLKNRVHIRKSTLPTIKIPAICDFEQFKLSENIVNEKYLMYCGFIGYLSVIEFIIDLYCKLRENKCYQGKLLLAIGIENSDTEAYEKLLKKIKECGFKDSIILKINVPHKKLIKIYLEAELLIAPFRNVQQDIAGFHHKVGEYCAAGKPIISTNLGEMKYYFKDGFSAILAEEYTIESYFKKLCEVLPHEGQLMMIAKEGNKVGLDKLNYINYGTELRQFILNL